MTLNYTTDGATYNEESRCWEWRDDEGKYHNEHGPALIYDKEGSEEWCFHGVFHRDGAPAIINPEGDEIWYCNGYIHRDDDDGPAASFADGSMFWVLHGVKHRIGGHAVVRADGENEWWVDGERIYDDEAYKEACFEYRRTHDGATTKGRLAA